MRLLKNPKPATLFLLVIVIYIFSGVLSGFEYRKITSIRKDLISKYQAADKYFKRAKSKSHKGDQCVNRLLQDWYFDESINAKDIETKYRERKEKN